MKTNLNILKAGALLFALPLMATAAVSANHWVSDNAPIELNVETSALESSLGVARVHTVALNANGAFEGRIATANAKGGAGLADLNVYFLRNGKVVFETTTAANGSFRAEGLEEGNYSFVATGENGFAAYGVRVVGPTAGIENVMEAAAIGAGFETVKQILDTNATNVAPTQMASYDATENLVAANRVKLVDGNLLGSVRSLVGADVDGSQVYILNGDQQVAEVQTDANGSFVIEGLAPGYYNFVSTGPSGFAAVSFEAISEAVADAEIPVSFKPSTLQETGFGSSLDVYTTEGVNVIINFNEIVYERPTNYEEFAPIEYAGESIGMGGSFGAAGGSVGNVSYVGGGGFAGGGGGFGGGGLGLGRLGRIALIGGAVAGIVALADDNDSGASSPTE